jgi:hypothetical protein
LGWIKGYIIDYIIKTNKRREIIQYILPNTISYIYTLSGFIKGLTTIFGEIDGAKKATIIFQTLY